MDGFSAGPGDDMTWLVEHAIHEQMMAYIEDIFRFFPDGLSSSTWQLAGVTTFPTGAVGLHYSRP
jgi:hypothetical protein